ncbi:MAG: twin-arginine translocase subunit TatC [Treponemataceae bacterium]|nr:twin-arginine translocase subunit TatC [Treponemataceae bacterium]
MNKQNPQKEMTFCEHLEELRRRIIVSLLVYTVLFVVFFLYYHNAISIFTDLFIPIPTELNSKLFVTTITEGFLVQLKVSATLALLGSLPFHLINIAQFVFPAFSKRTKVVISCSLLCSFVLAFLGAILSYRFIIPWSVRFFGSSFFLPNGVGILLNLKESISYVIAFIFWTTVVFQSPLIILVLLALNILSRRALFKASRFVIVLIFILAAVITPSVDPVSQCLIALPLIGLYGITLGVAKIFRLGEKASI